MKLMDADEVKKDGMLMIFGFIFRLPEIMFIPWPCVTLMVMGKKRYGENISGMFSLMNFSMTVTVWREIHAP